MIISPSPTAIRVRSAQMRARASSQAPAVNAFFGVFSGAPAAAEPLGVRAGGPTERLSDGFGRRLPDWAGWAGWPGWARWGGKSSMSGDVWALFGKVCSEDEAMRKMWFVVLCLSAGRV